MKDKKSITLLKDINTLHKEEVEFQKKKLTDRKWIAESMSQLRKSYGVRQGHVAMKMGVSQPFLAMLEKGRKNWNPRLAKKYLESFSV